MPWQDDALLAYQIGFDLFENEMQSFLLQVRTYAVYCCTFISFYNNMQLCGGQAYAVPLQDPVTLCGCKSSPMLLSICIEIAGQLRAGVEGAKRPSSSSGGSSSVGGGSCRRASSGSRYSSPRPRQRRRSPAAVR